MIMSIANTYPVFEADQVLTNNHLNELFNYLDQQNRLTRCKLLGSGIVCGLDISHTSDTININKGCGLTSQGYIILFCDHSGENGYKYMMPYNRPPFPNHLQLITQCGPDPDRNNILFYANSTARLAAAADNSIFKLLTQAEFDELDNQNGVIPLSQAPNLNEYAVVLFLEAEGLNLKNCDTNDCNDKGSKIDFEVVPLLVHKKLLRTGRNGQGNNLSLQKIELRRYNVPVKNLNSTDDVLNAFVELLDDGLLQRLINDLSSSFETYKHLLSGVTTNPFGTLADLKNNIDFILKLRPVYIQYYYDFIYDLLHALYEFRHRLFEITTECCGDEMQFPFHLTLGEASVNTNTNAQMAYRQYFIYSPLFDRESERSGEIRSLLMRMILMYQNFLITEKTFRENRAGLPQEVKITPSRYGHNFLSQRCIPYYYKVVHDQQDAVPEDLFYYWSFDKTRRGSATYNLSYHASEYSQADTVLHPLVYDIERYNFFRVEGHIGQPVNTALVRVKSIQQNFNLPFDVVALSADYIGALVRGEDPYCIIQDLESDYRVLIAEFICRLHNAFCYVGKLGFAAERLSSSADFMFRAEPVTDTSSRTSKTKKAASNTLFAAITEPVNLVADHPFIASLVGEFQATAVYTKGDTIGRLCAPGDNTFGRYYINSVIRNNGNFVNPISSTTDSASAVLQYHLFEFLDSVESMLQVLLTTELADLNVAAFKPFYNRFAAEVNFINSAVLNQLRQLAQKANQENEFTYDYLLDLFVTNVQMVLNTCIIERLEALRSEYLRRLAQYRLARNFNYYFKRHGGIEHKAGVPRGGTFILVYHEERRSRTVDLNSIFINRELSNLLLTQFRELLQPDVKADTLEAKAKMLSVATLHRDPALYLRFHDVMKQYLDDCRDLPDDKRAVLTGIINEVPVERRYDIPNGAVIADFYVPYICCSDCPPVAYILSEPVTLSIDPKEFCKGDKQKYPVSMSPEGGVLKVDGAEVPTDYMVQPSTLSVGKHTLTYTINNKTASTTIEVFALPKASFLQGFPQDRYELQSEITFELKPTTSAGAIFDWDFGDNVRVANGGVKQTHQYMNLPVGENRLTVTVTVIDGPCTITVQKNFIINIYIIT
jgi:hypothetical protein